METKLYKEIKLKNGDILEKGLPVFVKPIDDRICSVRVACMDYRLRYSAVFNPPSMEELEEWSYDGVVESVSGESVEPDGHDSLGFPSWLLAFGLI